MEAKQTVRELLDKLPDDCTLDDILYHLYVIHQLALGEADLEAGRTTSHEQVAEDLRRRWGVGEKYGEK